MPGSAFSGHSMFEELHNYRKRHTWLRQVASPVFVSALAAGVVLHLVGFLLFRVKSSDLPLPVEKPAFVNYVTPELLANESTLEAQAALFDSAPLFIPTEWSATHVPVQMGRDSVGDGFAQFEPTIQLAAELKPAGWNQLETEVVNAPIDLLALRFWNLFSSVGHTDEDPQPYENSTPSAIVQVLSYGSMANVEDNVPFELAVDLAERPLGLPNRPVRLLMLVSGAGRILTGPTLLQSSGDPAFDQAVVAWAVQPEVAVRLPVGYLEVEVYP